jgi:hypothetical protein
MRKLSFNAALLAVCALVYPYSPARPPSLTHKPAPPPDSHPPIGGFTPHSSLLTCPTSPPALTHSPTRSQGRLARFPPPLSLIPYPLSLLASPLPRPTRTRQSVASLLTPHSSLLTPHYSPNLLAKPTPASPNRCQRPLRYEVVFLGRSVIMLNKEKLCRRHTGFLPMK